MSLMFLVERKERRREKAWPMREKGKKKRKRKKEGGGLWAETGWAQAEKKKKEN